MASKEAPQESRTQYPSNAFLILYTSRVFREPKSRIFKIYQIHKLTAETEFMVPLVITCYDNVDVHEIPFAATDENKLCSSYLSFQQLLSNTVCVELSRTFYKKKSTVAALHVWLLLLPQYFTLCIFILCFLVLRNNIKFYLYMVFYIHIVFLYIY